MFGVVDIPTVVNVLVTFFASGGVDAGIELVKGTLANVSVKTADFLKLKDELLEAKEVAEQVKALQADPQNAGLQAQLKDVLTNALQQPKFSQYIHADHGGFAAHTVSGSTIQITNNGKSS